MKVEKDVKMVKGLLTADEVGRQLSISPGQVLTLSREGKLKRIQMGFRTVRFTQEEIDRFIREEEQTLGVEK